MTNTPRRPGAPPGSNNGGGRKKSARELVRVLRQVYADQLPASGEKIRAALELLETVTNALGNPHFNSAEVFDALKDVAPNGSLTNLNGSIKALLNILPDLEKVGKKQY